MHVLFTLRKNRRDSEFRLGTIYWYVTKGENEKSTRYSAGIQVYPKDWSSEATRAIGENGHPVNVALDEIRADLLEIYNNHKNRITHIQEIANLYTKKTREHITLIEAYDELVEKKVLQKVTEHTLTVYATFRNYWLIPFLENDLNNKELEARVFMFKHLDMLAEKMLRSEDVNSSGYIKMGIQKIKAAIRLAYSKGYIDKDAVASYEVVLPKWNPTYDYLEPEHVKALEVIKFTKEEHLLERARDLFVFQCYTGLNLIDLENFSKDEHFLNGKHGWDWIFKKRNKSDVSQFIPLLPEPMAALERLGYNIKPPVGHRYNTRIRICFKMARINKYAYNSLARPTLGAYLLNKGVSLDFVSRVLGHTSRRTTEKYYAKIIDFWGVRDQFDLLRERLKEEDEKNKK